jgi:hypothetical protein
MPTPGAVRKLETLSRRRLSANFFLRDFLSSETAQIYGISNVPDDPALAIEAGSRLCEELLEPLQATFGRLAIRSAYRSPEMNALCNRLKLGCARNEYNFARHIWDRRDARGFIGASASIIIPWVANRYAQGESWQPIAWWIHDHLPYSELQFFPKLAAFNIGWHQKPRRAIYSYIPPRGYLTRPGMPGHDANHAAEYAGYPVLSQAQQTPGRASNDAA